MAGNFLIKNANGKTVTLRNPDTNNADIVVDLSDVASGVELALVDISKFANSFGVNGYQKLPGGLIIQWGRVTTTVTNVGATWTFPIAFPNAVISYFAATENGTGGDYYSNIGPILTATGLSFAIVSSTYNGTATNSCFAIGY